MKNFAFLVFISLSIKCFSQSTDKFNLNFEKYSSSKNFLETGWTKAGVYEVNLDTAVFHSGKYAANIESKNGGSFGRIDYTIPAKYEGKTIQLTGFIKTQDINKGYAGIMLWTDNGDKTQAPDNLRIIKIDSIIDWKQYSITLPYPERVEKILLAGVLSGEGKAWFDDFVITIDGKNIQNLKEIEKPVFQANLDHEFDNGSKITIPKLDDKRIADLALLGKIWGFLKYYHPEVGEGNYNWDYELFRVLPDYLKAQDDSKRDQVLLDWIAGYGEVPLCEKCSETSADAPIKPDLSWIENSDLRTELVKTLQYIYKNRHQGEQFYIGLYENVGNPKFLNENPYSNMPYPDEGFRLLSLYRYWNAIQYFFPYKQATDKDWKNILKEYIPKFIDAKNELEYELAALQVIGDVKDTHANLWDGGNAINALRGTFYPPFSLQFVEDKLVVADYYKDELKSAAGLSVGDVITHIIDR